MAKDPAMLWYWGDWNSGTTILNRHLKGCYMDLLHAQFNNGHLHIEEIKTVLGQDFESAWPMLKKKFQVDKEGLFYNVRLDFEKHKRAAYTESRREAKLKNDDDTVKIYLLRDNDTGFTKIGSSVNPERRLAELLYQIDPAASLTPAGKRQYDHLYTSGPVERKLEKEIHRHFKSKRMKGEWFDMTDEDLDTLLRTFFRTSLNTIYHTFNQTTERTENENENRNKDLNAVGIEVGATGKLSPAVEKKAADFRDAICEYFSVKTIVTSPVYNSVHDFVMTVCHRNEIDIASLSLQNYMKYKARSQGERHNVMNWMGTKSAHYQDGQWIMIDWDKKNKNYNGQRNNTKGGIGQTDPERGKDYTREGF